MGHLKCEKCGQTLGILRWSGDRDIAVCTNGKCVAYRNPVSTGSYNPRPETRTYTRSSPEADTKVLSWLVK